MPGIPCPPHPSSSPARMPCSAPCFLGFKVCQGALKWPHTGSRKIPSRSNSGSTSHRSSAAWEVCSSTCFLEGPTPCTAAVCSKLWLVVTARGYSPYLYYLQKGGSSIEELFHGYTNKKVLMSYFPAASEYSECLCPTKGSSTARADRCLLQNHWIWIIWILKAL